VNFTTDTNEIQTISQDTLKCYILQTGKEEEIDKCLDTYDSSKLNKEIIIINEIEMYTNQ
jgi:hypothetical protein